MPRIVTMIASATEIVCALGFEDQLVARSHECDWPASVKRLPVCTSPRFDVHGSSGQIDQHVKSLLEKATSIYHVDVDVLKEVRPDIIVTQAQCEVCAVSEKDVEAALCEWMGSPSPPTPLPGGEGRQAPKIVSLSPNNLAEVWQSMRNVAEALGVPSTGETVVQQLQARVEAVATTSNSIKKTSVACLEWLDPLMAAGNWVPELVDLAGGCNLFGSAGKHSPWMTWDQLIAADPIYIIALPCGFDLAKTRDEMAVLTKKPEWNDLRAVREERIFVTDGNQFFNRPGPRLVESLEILAEIFHPELFSFGHEGIGWEKYK
jgi:iron complex transport system substrate-binding protein